MYARRWVSLCARTSSNANLQLEQMNLLARARTLSIRRNLPCAQLWADVLLAKGNEWPPAALRQKEQSERLAQKRAKSASAKFKGADDLD